MTSSCLVSRHTGAVPSRHQRSIGGSKFHPESRDGKFRPEIPAEFGGQALRDFALAVPSRTSAANAPFFAFGLVIVKAPYPGRNAKDMLERGVADPGYQGLRRFLTEVPDHQATNGLILLGSSTASGARRRSPRSMSPSNERHGYSCMVKHLQ